MAWRLEHISRDLNEKADSLATVATSLIIEETVFLLVYYQSESSTAANRVNEIG